LYELSWESTVVSKKQPSSLRESVLRLAADKVRAARARVLPRDPDVEKPREVYLAGCAAIAQPFVADGFRYRKSDPSFVRRRGGWKEEVSFQSRMKNVAGQRVALWVHAVIWNRSLQKWREEHRSPFAVWDRVAGGQLGNLREPTGWLDWDLADATSRAEVVADVGRAVVEFAFPYFYLFQDLPALHRRLLLEDVPSLDLKDATELFLCYLDQEAAQQYLDAWFERHRELSPRVETALSCLRDGSSPGQPAAFAAQAANLVHHYGLTVDFS
jgi:hypothetical protein